MGTVPKPHFDGRGGPLNLREGHGFGGDPMRGIVQYVEMI